MPKQLRDARITQRSLVLEQHNGLVYRGTVTTYTDTTHFKVSGFPEYGDADDFGDNFFKDYYVYVVWDAAGGGAAPQGESQPISAYTSSDGTFTHTALTTLLAVGDEVLLIHPKAFNASVISDLDAIKGTGFVTADDSLHTISTELAEILDLTRTAGDIAVTDSETTLYIDDAPTKIINGLSIKIDTTVIEAADTYDFKVYYRIASGGSLRVSSKTTKAGVQTEPIFVIALNAYRYGMKVTAQRTAGTNRTFPIEVIREA